MLTIFNTMNTKVIYTHTNKETNQVVYVGSGELKRAYDFNEHRRSKQHVELINSVGVDVTIVKSNLTPKKAAKLELKLIAKYGLDNLFNKNLSGSGMNSMTEEGKRSLASYRTGRKHSAETREKIRQGNLGKTITEETRKKKQESAPKRALRDRVSGVTYNSVKEAAADLGIKYHTLIGQLKGRGKVTTLRYI